MGRTDGVLFEFQGEIVESTSIENILERQLRQAKFLIWGHVVQHYVIQWHSL